MKVVFCWITGWTLLLVGCGGKSPKENQPPTKDKAPQLIQTHRNVPEVGDDSLRAIADQAVATLGIPPDQLRFQAASDQLGTPLHEGTPLVRRVFLYRRLIDGVASYGPGTSVRIGVGASGNLDFVKADWPRTLERRGRVEDHTNLDTDALVGNWVARRSLPAEAKLSVLGLRYLGERKPGDVLVVRPVLMVQIKDLHPADPGSVATVRNEFIEINSD
jgi:hypothetical protein